MGNRSEKDEAALSGSVCCCDVLWVSGWWSPARASQCHRPGWNRAVRPAARISSGQPCNKRPGHWSGLQGRHARRQLEPRCPPSRGDSAGQTQSGPHSSGLPDGLSRLRGRATTPTGLQPPASFPGRFPGPGRGPAPVPQRRRGRRPRPGWGAVSRRRAGAAAAAGGHDRRPGRGGAAAGTALGPSHRPPSAPPPPAASSVGAGLAEQPRSLRSGRRRGHVAAVAAAGLGG